MESISMVVVERAPRDMRCDGVIIAVSSGEVLSTALRIAYRCGYSIGLPVPPVRN